MPNYMEAAFAEHEARYAAHVMRDTWRHLDAVPGIKYPCTLIFAISEYSGDGGCLIRTTLHGMEGGPAFYSHAHDFIGNQSERRGDEAEGHVFQFDGTYRVFRTGRAQFAGKVQHLV